jgi:hypothetical protein
MKTTTEKLTELLRSEKARLEKELPGLMISVHCAIGPTGLMEFEIYSYEGPPLVATSQSCSRENSLEDAAENLMKKLDPATKAAELRKKADEIAAQIARLEGRAKA